MFKELRRKLEFLKVFRSPFKSPKIKFYFGKIKIGTPHFLPRKWIASEKEGYMKAIPKKIGMDIVPLGWKTKFDDYRYEYSPLISFVAFKKQFVILFEIEDRSVYWESWLYYHYQTDKNLSKEERIKICIDKNPMTYKVYSGKDMVTVDYYKKILKKKYIPLDASEIREKRLKKLLEKNY